MSETPNPYAAPETLDTSAPGAEWMHSGNPALSKTARGLSLVYFGILTVLLSMIAMVFGFVLGPIIAVAMFGTLVGAVMMVVGPIFCLSVPQETGAKGLITASVLFQGVGWLVSLGSMFGLAIPASIASLSSLLQFIGSVLFVLFMRRLSLYIGREDLALSAKRILVTGAVMIGAVALSSVLGIAGMAELSAMIMLPFMIVGLILFMMYANLVNSLRKAINPGIAS